MKILFITLLLTIYATSQAGMNKAQRIYLDMELKPADKLEKLTYELVKSKYYFSALVFAERRLKLNKPIDERFEDAILTLALKTGVDSFDIFSVNDVKRHKSETLAFSTGLKLFKQQKFLEAKKALSHIRKTHKFAPESMLIMGSIYGIQNKFKSARKLYKSCIASSDKEMANSDHNKMKRYYKIISESCQIHIARLEYKQGNYEQSIKEYNSISKNSYRFPYIILEKAWAYYKTGDYNRTLGGLVTYKSPLLSSYFFPEAEALAALSYFRLCLWNDSSIVIQKYYDDYRVETEKLKKILRREKNSKDFFFNLAMKPLKDADKQHAYLRNLVNQTKKQIKFSMDYVPYMKATNELKHLKKFKSNLYIDYLKKHTMRIILKKKTSMNHHIKRSMFDFVNQIHRYSKELFKIKLEIMSKKRSLLYKNEQLISKRARGDISNVDRKIDQHFWNFKGAFWADELGDYSFGLKSNCKSVKTQKKRKE